MLKTIYSKTDLGRLALKERSAELSPKARSAFILFDGVRSLPEVLTATAGLGITEADVDHMVACGFLSKTEAPSSPPSAVASAAVPVNESSQKASSHKVPVPVPLTDHQDRYRRAYPLAAQLTSSLGLRGFRLNLAVEAAGNLEQLRALAPKIREVVGPEKCRDLEHVLWGMEPVSV